MSLTEDGVTEYFSIADPVIPVTPLDQLRNIDVDVILEFNPSDYFVDSKLKITIYSDVPDQVAKQIYAQITRQFKLKVDLLDEIQQKSDPS